MQPFGKTMNPYIELGITPAATFDELKQAYRRAVFRYHPDSACGQGNAEKFNAALKAYEALKIKYEKRTASLHHPPTYRPAGTQTTSAPFISIDRITLQMPVEHLIYNLENSDNIHVRLAAMKALVLKNSPKATAYLLNFLHHIGPETQCYLIRIMGELKLVAAAAGLFPWIFSQNAEVAFATIKSLEIITPVNRAKIVKYLKTEKLSPGKAFLSPFQKAIRYLSEGRKKKILGKILLNNQRISSEQLQIALWLQKKHQLLLGATLTKLGYTSRHDIQQALLIQKR